MLGIRVHASNFPGPVRIWQLKFCENVVSGEPKIKLEQDDKVPVNLLF